MTRHDAYTRPAPTSHGDGPATDTETKHLIELHTRLRDTIDGFDAILDKAEPEFRPVAAEFRALHIRQADAVATMLDQDGHDTSKDGSMFGTVNKAVVTVRSWFDDISVNIMEQVVNGEKHVLEAYDEALPKAADPERKRILSEHRSELMALLTRHTTD